MLGNVCCSLLSPAAVGARCPVALCGRVAAIVCATACCCCVMLHLHKMRKWCVPNGQANWSGNGAGTEGRTPKTVAVTNFASSKQNKFEAPTTTTTTITIGCKVQEVTFANDKHCTSRIIGGWWRAICGTSSHNNDDVGGCEFKRASSQWGSNFIIMQQAFVKRKKD